MYCTTDRQSEFHRLVRIDVVTGAITPLTANIPWDVDLFEVAPDGKTIAYVTNEDGVSVLHFLNPKQGKEKPAPALPKGVIGGIEWHENGRDLGFTMAHARSASDAYSVELKTGNVTRWTESELGGLDASRLSEPELIKMKSFDGTAISAWIYRPDSKKFPGPRPILVNIHGGPESQSRPIFQGRNNFYMDELGIAIVFPNVRGSAGYGKSFLRLDNGFLREDSVRDIGAVIDWIERSPGLDAQRIGVTGGSYGGYMCLASLIHFGNRIRAGVDVVGISNFVTFLESTQGYRRDLRRVEYGDERDTEMRAHLQKISPLTQANRLKRPLLVVQGKNDPRVPISEAEQMVKAVRDQGGTCWYLMAKDEGHGFAKKKNVDFQFLSTVLFWQEQLVK